MKLNAMLFILAVAVLSLTSCDKAIQPSGNVTQMEYSITGFTAVDISDAFRVNVTFDPGTAGVVIETDDNLHEYIDVKKINDRLYIGVERKYNISGPATLNAYVSTPDAVTGFYASGASTLILDDLLSGGTIQMEVSGASQILGPVDVTRINAYISGASGLELSGEAGTLVATASGASAIGSFTLVTDNLDVELSGASSTRLTVNGMIDVAASGASTLYYKGDASINSEQLSGASQVIKID